jgi:hypothetical protein
MKKQLQYTTTFVVVLLVILVGSLYMINTSPAFDGQSNQLTAATTATTVSTGSAETVETADEGIDCTIPPTDATLNEQLDWEEECA